MNGGIFYVTLKLEDVGNQMAGLETTTERGEWLEGFNVGVHGHQARDQWSSIKMQGYEFGALVLGEAVKSKGKFSKAGKASAETRKAAKGTAQPERRSNDVEATIEKRSEHSSNYPLTTNHEPIPTTQKPRTKKSFLLESAEAVYMAYPRKAAKDSALKAITKALAKKPLAEMLDAVEAYSLATSAWSDEEKSFIPYPASWFNAGRWDDDRATWASKRKTTNSANILTRTFDKSYYEEQ